MSTDAEMKPIVPMMGGEGGFETEEPVAPLRLSGFIALLFGLLSVLSLIGYPMIVTAIIAIALGLFALRPWTDPKPVGITPAKLGLLLAVGFGSCGFFIHTMKSATLGQQAEYFARQYLDVIGSGEFAIALELKKNAVDRLPTKMPLMEHYESTEETMTSFTEFETDLLNQQILALGPGVAWQRSEPVRVFQSYGTPQAEVFLENPDRDTEPKKIYLLLKCEIDPQGIVQWRVDQCRAHTEQLVAESIL
ncbi:hypothetical protein Pla52o_32540 [Novipirellula galeiformis]|uniref:Uncharacterized protein n=1 Tax=Novipirellula galeiformis TaxID=2528004 RepID=A0A5C6CHJ1_9BACT|nr:hypothetical protein [Novipirellula galeiformis]TWU22199.1 hypothetical protein Pla52o_32540 [Novipirellula galeiformis]